MNVSLTKKQEEYIADQIHTGDYQNASELVRDALRLHQVYREKIIKDLRTEIEKGRNSGVGDNTLEDILEGRLKK